MRTDEELVVAARTGEPDAFGSLVERWTGRCWDIAWRILHDRDLAADVAQETLLTAWQQLDRLEQPGSFGGWVSRIARNRSLDRLERERRAVPTGDHEALEVHASRSRAGASVDDDPVAALDSSQQQELVWAASAALGERDASVLDLHLRHGLEPRELAEELGIAPNNAHQVLFRLRQRLGSAIRAWLLWRGGRPSCSGLAAALAVADVEVFGAEAVAVVEAHAGGCLACDRDRTAVVAPAAMFAAVPLAAMPLALADRVVTALQHAGVPVPAGGAAGLEGAAGVDIPAADIPVADTPVAGATGFGGDSAEAGGAGAAGDSAAAGGAGVAGDSAAAGSGGADSAEAGGAGAAGDSAEAGPGGDQAGPGGAAHAWGAPTKLLVGAAGAIAVVLLWLAFAGGAPDLDTLAGEPSTDPPTGADPTDLADPADSPGDDSDAPTQPPFDGFGGQRYSPVIPFGAAERSAEELDAADDPAGAPAGELPEFEAPPSPPDGGSDGGTDDGGSADDDGNDNGNGNGDDGDGDGDGNGDDGDDQEPAPLPTVTAGPAFQVASGCRTDPEGTDLATYAFDWETTNAEQVTWSYDGGGATSAPVNPQEPVQVCAPQGVTAFLITATGADGATASDVAGVVVPQ